MGSPYQTLERYNHIFSFFNVVWNSDGHHHTTVARQAHLLEVLLEPINGQSSSLVFLALFLLIVQVTAKHL